MAGPSRSASFTRAFWKAKFEATAVSLIATFVLAGCAASPPPEASPSGTAGGSASPSASATPTSTPTPTATYKPADTKGPAQNVPLPVKAAGAESHSAEGLKSFAKHWYSLLSYAYETGDLTEWTKYSSDSCENCKAAEQTISGWHSEGRWIVGGAIKVDSATTNFSQNRAGEYQVLVAFQQDQLDFYLSNGKLNNSVPKTDTPITDLFVVKPVADGWTVVRVGPVG